MVFVPTKKRSSNGWQRQTNATQTGDQVRPLAEEDGEEPYRGESRQEEKAITTDRRQTMAKKSKSTQSAASIYQLKITLGEVKPPVWRRIQVEDCSLAGLHDIIQVCMGWSNSHLYSFELDGVEYGDPETADDGDFCDSDSRKLSQIASEGPSKFTYLYDFGDDWEHVVKIEKVLPPEANVKYPRCVAGERACPPEDCGGAYGYENLLEAIQNPKHEEHEEILEWVGGKFDPEAFDVDGVNRNLKDYR
jgi:hypothetical protein